MERPDRASLNTITTEKFMAIDTRTVKAIYALAFACVFALAGCAFSTKMVDDKGATVECSAAGVGPISGTAAAASRDACVSKYKALGYRQVTTP
jgi:hypothetical protein